MGRILEALGQREANRCPAPEPPLTLHAGPPEVKAIEEEEAGEVSFIEVGGPRKIIDASPDVLACAPPVAKTSAASPSERPTPAQAPTDSPGLKSVSFRPLSPAHLPLPQGRFAAELVAFHQPAHPLAEGYRSLLEGIRGQLPAGKPQVLMFTAPATRTGATTVLLNLAITAARSGDLRVAALDANRRHSDLARRLGLPAAPGLREVLTGSASLAHALQETGLSNLWAMTAGKGGEDGGVRLVMEAMPMVLRLLREQFALVLVDAPSWDAGPDAAALAAACDAAYLVVEQARAETPEVAAILQTLRHEGSPLCGCILTQW